MTSLFKKSMLSISTLAATSLFCAPALANQYKHVAVAPEHISQQQLPSAESKALLSHSTMLPIYAHSLSKSKLNGKATIEQTLNLDGDHNSPVVLLSPVAKNWFMAVTDPTGKVVYDECQYAWIGYSKGRAGKYLENEYSVDFSRIAFESYSYFRSDNQGVKLYDKNDKPIN